LKKGSEPFSALKWSPWKVELTMDINALRGGVNVGISGFVHQDSLFQERKYKRAA
jgi:hypothetical protein